MPIRLDNNGKRKALICEELKPETRYEEHIRIEVPFLWFSLEKGEDV